MQIAQFAHSHSIALLCRKRQPALSRSQCGQKLIFAVLRRNNLVEGSVAFTQNALRKRITGFGRRLQVGCRGLTKFI